MTSVRPPRPMGCYGLTGPKIGSQAKAPGQSHTHDHERKGHTKRWSPALLEGGENGGFWRFYPLVSAQLSRNKLSKRMARASRVRYFLSRTVSCALAAGGGHE